MADGRVQELFDDARATHTAALARLAAGDIRDAAEKAWRATKSATDALILARGGVEPGPAAQTSNLLDDLAAQDGSVKSLVGRYYSRIGQLRNSCYYDGICNEHTERRIRETAIYIDDAENLA